MKREDAPSTPAVSSVPAPPPTARRQPGAKKYFVIDSGDPYAQSLARAARGVIMSPPPEMTRELATSLLDLVRAELGTETSQFVGPKLAGSPLTPQDNADGQALISW